MNSFNVYTQTETKVGGNTPVWLGTVKPIPRGAIVYGGLSKGSHFMAGVPVKYIAETKQISSFCSSVEEAIGEANAYLYNDVYSEMGDGKASCAIVMHHPEGLLIERVLPEITEEQIQQLQAKIPGVLLVRG